MVVDDKRRSLALLANERRQRIIRCLDRGDEPLTPGELAVYIASAEGATPADAVDDEHRRDVEVMLHHNHLPKLDAAEAVVYDVDAKTVTRGANFPLFAAMLAWLQTGNGEFELDSVGL